MPVCFRCGKDVVSAVRDEEEKDIWSHPLDASMFEGGHTYGSSVYDSLASGVAVFILICDDCLKKNKDRIKEVEKNIWS